MKYAHILVAALALLAVVGLAAAAPSVSDERPDYVNCEYNETKLSDYQPELELDHVEVKPTTLYSTYCTSPEYDEDVAMYIAYYPVQDSLTSADSHRLDREPVYVFIDDETGEVTRVTYSAYHYIKGEDTSPALNGSNPGLRVAEPHHHYQSTAVDGEFVDLRPLSEEHQAWYDNGWKAESGVTANPYGIDGQDSWWSEDAAAWDYKAAEWYWKAKLRIAELSPFSDPVTDL